MHDIDYALLLKYAGSLLFVLCAAMGKIYLVKKKIAARINERKDHIRKMEAEKQALADRHKELSSPSRK